MDSDPEPGAPFSEPPAAGSMRPEKLIGLCCCAVYAGSAVLLFYFGFTGMQQMEELSEFEHEVTTEMCLILDYEAFHCKYYECPDGSDESCEGEWVHGILFEYEAIAPSKCGNQTLYIDDWDTSDPECDTNMELREPGTTHSCHVLDCEEESFSFASSTDKNDDAISMIIVGVILLIVAICCMYCFWNHINL